MKCIPRHQPTLVFNSKLLEDLLAGRLSPVSLVHLNLTSFHTGSMNSYKHAEELSPSTSIGMQCNGREFHPSIYPSIHLSIHPSIHPFIHLSFHPSTHSSFRPSIYLSVSPSICLSVCLSVGLSVNLSMYICMYVCMYVCM